MGGRAVRRTGWQLISGEGSCAELDPVLRRELAARRPALVIASDLYLEQADTLAIIVPVTTNNRGWPNHVRLKGSDLALDQPSFAMT